MSRGSCIFHVEERVRDPREQTYTHSFYIDTPLGRRYGNARYSFIPAPGDNWDGPCGTTARTRAQQAAIRATVEALTRQTLEEAEKAVPDSVAARESAENTLSTARGGMLRVSNLIAGCAGKLQKHAVAADFKKTLERLALLQEKADAAQTALKDAEEGLVAAKEKEAEAPGMLEKVRAWYKE